MVLVRHSLAITLLLLGCGGRLEEPTATSDAAPAVEVGLDAGLEFDIGPGLDAAIEWDVAPPPASVDATRGDASDPGDEICPSVPPKDGAACTMPATPHYPECTYGDSVVPGCRVSAFCSLVSAGTSVWSVSGTCYADPRCGVTAPKTGEGCTASGVCGYVDGALCECMPSPDGPRWQCYRPEPGCPTFIPNAGSACTTEGLGCSYGPTVCAWGRHAACVSGRWRWVNDCRD